MTNEVAEIFENYWKIKSYQSEMPFKIPAIISSGDPQYEAQNLQAQQLNIYFADLKEGDKMLDVGAGDKQIEKAILTRGLKVQYCSMDTAHRADIHYDFGNLDDIHEKFDLIIMQEVVEHLPLEVGYHYFKRAYALLNDTGYLVVTTPNTRRPMRFRHADFTHIQHYPLHDLYGLLRSIGFAGPAVLRRIEIRSTKLGPLQHLKRIVQRFLYGLMDFDYTHSILVKIRKA